MTEDELLNVDDKLVQVRNNWEDIYRVLEVLNLYELTYPSETEKFIRMMDEKINSFPKIKSVKELKKIIKVKKILRDV